MNCRVTREKRAPVKKEEGPLKYAYKLTYAKSRYNTDVGPMQISLRT